MVGALARSLGVVALEIALGLHLEAASREHHAMAGDHLEHGPRLRQYRAVGGENRNRLDLDPLRAQLALELSPMPAGRARQRLAFGGLVDRATVGIQTVRAPSRAAISTARTLMPPVARLSEIAPRARIPGTAARTTPARSAVEP